MPPEQLTAKEAEDAANIIADVLWWFKGFDAATPPERCISTPDMRALTEVKLKLDRLYN